jgi:chromosome segregation ATPase
MFASEREGTMRKFSLPKTPAALCWALVLSGLFTGAQAADREQELINRLRTQNRQLEQDLAAAQEARAKAEAQAKAAPAPVAPTAGAASVRELRQARASASASSRRLADLDKELQASKDAAAQADKDKQALQAKLQEQAEQLARVKSEGEAARQAQQTMSAQHAQCRADNAKLYSTGVELLERYESKGMGEVFSSREPFLQLGRVTLENVGAQYADALKAAKLKP